jgi:hypothetical protein
VSEWLPIIALLVTVANVGISAWAFRIARSKDARQPIEELKTETRALREQLIRMEGRVGSGLNDRVTRIETQMEILLSEGAQRALRRFRGEDV